MMVSYMKRKSLTAISVEKMKPPASGQVEVFDAGFPGFALRVSHGGSKAWAMFYRHDGQPIPSPGIIVIAKIDSDVERLNVPGSVKLTT